jgi:hypothetical protein
MTPVELSIIIVNWNSKEYVRKCVASILANTFGVNYEIIVVDSGSFDGCGDLLSLAYPEIRFIQSQDNVGFARANNLGAAQAQGSFFLFLNPDTEVRPGAIEHVFRHASRLTDLGVAGCRLLNTDGSLQTSCVQSLPTILNQVLDADALRRWFPSARLFGTAALFVPGPGPREVEAISGAFMMIRRHVFERLGGFSVEYFMYGEDLDLCFKSRCHGFRNYYVAEAIVIHHGGGSTQRTLSKFSTVMMLESVHRLLRKFRGPRYGVSYRVALSGAASIRLVLLGLLFPAWFAVGTANAWTSACRKWCFVLRWGLTLERWTKRYGQPNPAPAPSNGRMETSCAGSAEN